jgi:hypothetical protein
MSVARTPGSLEMGSYRKEILNAVSAAVLQVSTIMIMPRFGDLINGYS